MTRAIFLVIFKIIDFRQSGPKVLVRMHFLIHTYDKHGNGLIRITIT